MLPTASKILSTAQSSLLMLARNSHRVHHDVRRNRFYIKIGRSQGSILYSKEGEVYDLLETFIPKELRGKGYGCLLAKSVFDHVVENDLKMKLTCEFLIRCYNKDKKRLKKYVVE